MPDGYLVQCFNCLSDFDAAEAIWCSCNPQRPTKVCPFCLGCFCAAGQEFKDSFWREAPGVLREEIATLSQSRMLIGEMLVRSGLISTDQLLEALTRQKDDGRRLGEVLVDSGALQPDRLEKFLQSQHTVIAVDLSRARVDAPMLKRLGVDQCLRERILPLEAEAFRDRHIMTLAMADPSNAEAIERVMRETGYQVIPGVVPAESIMAVIRSIFPQGSASAERTGAPSPRGEGAGQPLHAAILGAAVRRRASHVQIQASEGALRLFFRIDGTLYLDRARPPQDVSASLADFKAMAGLHGDTRTVPRVGRALFDGGGLEHVVIVRTRPGREGEEMSIKIIDPVAFPPRLDDLGLPALVLEHLRQALGAGRGLVAVSSPPFSGSSSTLHALVTEAMEQGTTAALIESPRAVTLAGAEQMEFFPEIRNSLSGAIARAGASPAALVALTAPGGAPPGTELLGLSGRKLVLLRLEALTLAEALLKLAASGYDPAALADRPALVVHQRLVRRICPSCRTSCGTAEDHAAALGLTSRDARAITLCRGAGCRDCGSTPGFRGRSALAHALRPDRSVAAAVASGQADAVAAACRAAGLPSLHREALAALSAGATTVEEITRRRMA